MNYNDIESKVVSKNDLVQFIIFLKQDLIKNKKEWENQRIQTFLAGMEGFINDSKSFSDNPKWADFAKILYAGSRYE
ncbi:hypothetical protein LC087_16470 [Bacillus carboniphilus]|uniref:DUF7660 domain-containing protein n=1 Tax=Bacillus carboniphilus TaxID=86663 RepID=A0ABY9JSC2_9BACI|nr:hypothetical protein [Bacillus carboniphilus]WLR42296.1 hypothetical protein LC087_16470 [Bacillus carboniphilus]